MVGDKSIDLECGWNAGVQKCILVRTGYGAELERSKPEVLVRAWVMDDLSEAVARILE
jgi:phosphoglycolate phosphatase-like HAD superfamily hydrolase